MNVEKMKKQLEKRLRELNKEARTIDADLHKPGDPDFEERAVEIEGEEVLEGIGQVVLDELGQIQSALSRIEAKTYGVCVNCGEAISAKRLELVPYAAKCIKCA